MPAMPIPVPISSKNRWDDDNYSFALLSNNNYKVQFVGLHSPSQIIFVRIVPYSFSPVKDCRRTTSAAIGDSSPQQIQFGIGEVVQVVIDNIQKYLMSVGEESEDVAGYNLKQKVSLRNWPASSHEVAKEMVQLGSVWLLKQHHYKEAHSNIEKRCSKKNSRKAQRRLIKDDFNLIPDWSCNILRIHLLPLRFPAAHDIVWAHCSPREDVITCQNGYEHNRVIFYSSGENEGIILFEVSNTCDVSSNFKLSRIFIFQYIHYPS